MKVLLDVTESKYVGVTLTSDKQDTQYIQNKIRRGNNVIQQVYTLLYYTILWKHDLIIETRKRISLVLLLKVP